MTLNIQNPKYTYKHDRGTYWVGDTIPAWSVQLEGIDIASACCHLKDDIGNIVHTYDVIVLGDEITIPGFVGQYTADWKEGMYSSEIEFTLTNGIVRTYVEWTVKLLRKRKPKCQI